MRWSLVVGSVAMASCTQAAEWAMLAGGWQVQGAGWSATLLDNRVFANALSLQTGTAGAPTSAG